MGMKQRQGWVEWQQHIHSRLFKLFTFPACTGCQAAGCCFAAVYFFFLPFARNSFWSNVHAKKHDFSFREFNSGKQMAHLPIFIHSSFFNDHLFFGRFFLCCVAACRCKRGGEKANTKNKQTNECGMPQPIPPSCKVRKLRKRLFPALFLLPIAIGSSSPVSIFLRPFAAAAPLYLQISLFSRPRHSSPLNHTIQSGSNSIRSFIQFNAICQRLLKPFCTQKNLINSF